LSMRVFPFITSIVNGETWEGQGVKQMLRLHNNVGCPVLSPAFGGGRGLPQATKYFAVG